MGGRFYDPEIRRFITPDPIVPDPYNPSDYNRYSYVRNNPLAYRDPTGHQPKRREVYHEWDDGGWVITHTWTNPGGGYWVEGGFRGKPLFQADEILARC